jgi:2-methylcitrate dehydratase PrpD
MRWLLDYAAQQASGIASWARDPDHIEKAFVFGGMPARNGVTAALLVHGGATGIEDVFAGPDNFLIAQVPDAQPAELVAGLGERFEITRTNIKRWTVGSPIQAPLDAIDLIRRKRAFTPDEVTAVEVRMASQQARVVDNREIPDINLQHMVAVMLLDGTASFDAAHEVPRMRDPAVLRQRAKVRLVGDAALEALLPRREAIVAITLADGAVLTERVGEVRGTMANPMERAEVVAKARDLMAPVLGAAQTAALIAASLGVETLPDIRALGPLLRRG